MAIAEIPQGGPLALPGGNGSAVRPNEALGVFVRPQVEYGWKAWLTGVDHKKVGVMYGAAALFFFIAGGLEALLVRAQLAVPDGKLISADLYNQAFTMHGVTMVFLVIMPATNSQKLTELRKGNATSRAPICRGMTRFMIPNISPIATKKIMMVP